MTGHAEAIDRRLTLRADLATVRALIRRSANEILRVPGAAIPGVLAPTIFFLGLTAVFGGLTALPGFTADEYQSFIIPISLLQGAGFTGAATGVNLARDIEQHVHVLPRRHAAEQDQLNRRVLGQSGDVPHQRLPVPGVIRLDVHRAERPQVLQSHSRIRGQEPAVGGDHLNPCDPGTRPGESRGIGELPPKVETTQETERLPQ